MILFLEAYLPDERASVPVARRVCQDLLRHLGVAADDVEDVVAVVGELATNAVQHARSPGGFRVHCELHEDHVLVAVTDWGRGIPEGRLPEPGTARADESGHERFGGWGLPLVCRLTEAVSIGPAGPDGGGTTVRAQRRIRHADLPHARAAGRQVGGHVLIAVR